jgi:hypothetical protein
MGHFHNHGVGVSEQAQQNSHRIEFVAAQADHAYCFHLLFSSDVREEIRKSSFPPSDKVFVSRFLQDAEQILAASGPAGESEFSILIHGQRGIHMVAGKSDWPLESLLRESGAGAAYRVVHSGGEVRVEGRSRSESCVLRKRTSAAMLRDLLPERRLYEVFGPQCGSAERMLLT